VAPAADDGAEEEKEEGAVKIRSKKRKHESQSTDGTQHSKSGDNQKDDDEDDDDEGDESDEAEYEEDDGEEAPTAANMATLKRIQQKLSAASARGQAPWSSSRQKAPEDDFGFTRSGGNAGGVSRTSEGYKIYQINSLNMGHGKDTPLCPIDCECCF
jgi:hypothetical protein